MEKDILIQNLRSKLGEDTASVISEKTFDGIATVYLPQFSDDESITDESWTAPLAVLKAYAGQKRHDDKQFAEKFKTDYAKQFAEQHEKDVEERIRKAASDAVEAYKKESGKNNGEGDEKDLDTKVAEAVSSAIAGLTGEDGVIGKLSKTVTDFTNSFKEQEKSASEKKLRSELAAYLRGRKADKDAVIELTVGQIELGDTPDLAELKVLAEKNYESNYKKFYGDGGQPFGGKNAGDGEGSFVSERLKKLEEEAKESANYAESLEKTFQ